MRPAFHRRVQRYGWDKAAGYYEACWQEQLRPAQERLLYRVALQAGERVLETACGTGLVTFPTAAAVGSDGEVFATDLSEGMLEVARRIAAERGTSNIVFERMDAEDLDLPERAFDVAICSLGLMYVPDPGQALREMHRVLVPGGRAVAAVCGRREKCGWAEVFRIVDRRVESDVGPLFFQLGTDGGLEAAFQTAGFEDVEAERFSVLLRYETREAACDAAFRGGAEALAWRKFDEKTRQSAEEEYLASIQPYRNGSGYDIPGEFVVATCRKPGRHKATYSQKVETITLSDDDGLRTTDDTTPNQT